MTAQTIDDSVATNQPLFNKALIASGRSNSDTVLQGASSFTTGGQLVSPQFFPFANLNLNVLGSLASSGDASANFFSFHEAGGAEIGLDLRAIRPSTVGTQLVLLDGNGNLVAISQQNGPDGLSSVLDFKVAPGGGGTFEAEVTQSNVGSPAPFDYKLQFALPFTEVSEFTTNVVGGGALKNGSLGAYDVNANAGDELSFDVPFGVACLHAYRTRACRPHRQCRRRRERQRDRRAVLRYPIRCSGRRRWGVEDRGLAGRVPSDGHALRLRSRDPRRERNSAKSTPGPSPRSRLG